MIADLELHAFFSLVSHGKNSFSLLTLMPFCIQSRAVTSLGSLIHDEYMEMAKTKPWTKSVVQLIISFGSQEDRGGQLKKEAGHSSRKFLSHAGSAAHH